MDPVDPAVLVVSDSWPPEEHAAIENAAESWNLEFGTQLSVRSDRAGDLEGPQVRFIVDEPELCDDEIEGWAGSQKEIELCPDLHEDPRRIFDITLHEIGHTFGIGHVQGPDSVMTSAVNGPRTFSDEDHDIFFDVHSDYLLPDNCDVIRRLGKQSSLTFLEHQDRALYAAAIEGSTLQIVTLDPGANPLRSVESELHLDDEAWELQHHSTQTGSLLTWWSQRGVHFAALTSMQLEPARTLELSLAAQDEYVLTRTVAAFNGLLYVARSISSDASTSRLEIQTFDLRTGAQGPTFHHPNMMGRMVVHEGALYLKTGVFNDGDVVVGLYRLEVQESALALLDFRELATLEAPEGVADGHAKGFVLRSFVSEIRSTPQGLLTTGIGGIALYTVDSTLKREALIDLPPDHGLFSVTHAAGPQDRWALGITSSGWFNPAVELWVLELKGLEPLGSWRRVSAPDLNDTFNAELFYQDELLISTWEDVSKRFIRQRKLRCIER